MRNCVLRSAIQTLVISIVASSFAVGGPINTFTKRYVYMPINPATEKSMEFFKQNMATAAGAGYNGICVASSKWAIIKNMKVNGSQWNNFKNAKAEADKLGLHLIPLTMGQTTPTREDTSVAEAFPVRETPFTVSGNTATASDQGIAVIKNGGFEAFTGNKPEMWRIAGGIAPGINMFVDPADKKEGAASIRVEHTTGTATIAQSNVTVRPFRAYELSAWIKTQNYAGYQDLAFMVSGSGRSSLLRRRDRCFMTPKNWNGVQRNQPWLKHVIDFNSLEESAVKVTFAFSEGKDSGKVWVDDIQIREVGLYQTLRRSSLPIVVKSADGNTTFTETTDYVVGPQKLTIPPGSKIADGAQLKVSWYQYANVETMNPPTAFCTQKVWNIVDAQFTKLNDLFEAPKAWFLGFDEWRAGFWDPACHALYPTAGAYVGGAAAECERMLIKKFPGVEVYMWNDMHSPYHNARPNYYMFNGSLEGSWDSLTTHTVVFNWLGPTNPSRVNNFRIFGGLDPKHPHVWTFQVIAGYYEHMGNIRTWLDTLDRLEKEEGLRGVIGFMYTTWQNEFKDLVPAAELIRETGRWERNQNPFGLPAIRTPHGLKKAAVTASLLRVKRKAGAILFTFDVVEPGKLSLAVYDVQGREIALLADRFFPNGRGQACWNLDKIPGGVYWARLVDEYGTSVAHHKVVVD